MALSRVPLVAASTLFYLVVCFWAVPTARAQTFSSGSTGADGALDLATMNCPGSICEVQLPPSGVLNYTTVNVPSGRILVFRKNLQNTPVVMLAQGAVTIASAVYVSPPRAYLGAGGFREPGPGGFYGGPAQPPAQPGFGPGGGMGHGQWVGPLSLVPIVGGSGGAGTGNATYGFGEGAGGAGAIVIASSTTIVVNANGGSISATGGTAYCSYFGCLGASGSGGAIRLVANSVVVAGSLQATGGGDAYTGNLGGSGVIRLEAPAGALSFTGSATPAAVLSPINPAIFATAPSSLSIVSVGGYAVPAYAGQRFDTVDVLLPTQMPDPINVVVAATNIPVGTSVGIAFGTTNAGTVVPGTLAGTLQSSSATIQLSGLNRTALAYLFVSATFSVPSSAAPLNAAGPDRVAQVRVSAPPGGAPRYSYLRADGSTVDPGRLPPEFLRQFQH